MNKWIENISYSFLGKLVAMVFLMLLDVVAARFLTVDSYAEWVYFFAILTMMFWIGWFGINTSVKVFVSKSDNKIEQASCIISALIVRLTVSMGIALMIYIIMPMCAYYLGYPDKYHNLKWLFGISAILVFFNSFTELFKEIFMGTEEFKSLYVLTVTEYFGYFFFSLIGMLIIKNIKSITYGYLISGILVTTIGVSFLIRNYKNEIGVARVSFNKYMKPIFKYAIPIALTSLGGMILVEMDTFMLGLMSTKEDVAVYSIAKNLCSKATHSNYALSVGVMTSFSIITGENYVQKKADFRKAGKLNYLLTVVVIIGFLLLGQPVVDVFYGEQYIRSGAIIKQLVIYYALYGISNFYSLFLDFRNKAVARSVWYVSVVAINLVLNYLWVPRYGAEGAAWATNLSLVPYTVYVIIASNEVWKSMDK